MSIDPLEEDDRPPRPDPVIEAYKQGVDRTLLRENLGRTPEQRVVELMTLLRVAEEFRRAGRALRSARSDTGLDVPLQSVGIYDAPHHDEEPPPARP